MPTLYLVRHGETDWNLNRRVQGSADIPLNATGIAQADATATELADMRIGAIIASDLSRAMATAAPIAAVHGLDVGLEPRLRERSFGVAEGRFDDDLAAEYGTDMLRAIFRTADATFPGGETVREHQERVAGYLDELLAGPPVEAIVLVSHGGTVRRALNHLAGIAPENEVYEFIENGSIHSVVVDPLPDAASP